MLRHCELFGTIHPAIVYGLRVYFPTKYHVRCPKGLKPASSIYPRTTNCEFDDKEIIHAAEHGMVYLRNCEIA